MKPTLVSTVTERLQELSHCVILNREKYSPMGGRADGKIK